MKIEKYTKLKGNKYNVCIDGINIKLYDDVIIKFELLRKKEISNELFKEIVMYNDYLEAYYKALKYLTKRMRTEKEVYLYLIKDFDKKVVKETIAKLKNDGYLNEEVYIKCYIDDQLILGNMGPNKIIKELVNLGCSHDAVNKRITSIDDEIWLDKIEKIINKKVRLNKNYGVNKLKDKIIYELGNMGYYKWMIDLVLKRTEFNDTDGILEKEYKKIMIKLTKKYEGNELKFKVINKLLAKGFTYEQIKKILND